jgi:nucleoid-associated protein YgaU
MGKDAHMRNDVKLGLAIGGVLLAVLIVYVLVVPAGGKKAPQANQQNPTGVTIEPAPDGQAAIPAPPPEAPAATFTPSSPATPSTANESAAAPAEQTASAAPANGKEIDWAKLLDGQQTLIAETPVPAPRSDAANVTVGAANNATGANAQESTVPNEPAIPNTPAEAPAPAPTIANESPAPAAPTQPEVAAAPPAEPTVQPTSPSSDVLGPTKERTHVIREGETLSSISAVAYGTPNQYPAIVRANPGLDPNRLKVGTTINLPAINLSATAADASTASARIAPAIDATKQYRVLPGDSLHKISLKLYGKSDRANKIYELNRKIIGDDPAKVRAGSVLELPEPPTQTASR